MGFLDVGKARLEIDGIFAEVDATAVADEDQANQLE